MENGKSATVPPGRQGFSTQPLVSWNITTRLTPHTSFNAVSLARLSVDVMTEPPRTMKRTMKSKLNLLARA